MAKRNTLTAKDAKTIGVDLDNINPLAIPENVSPVIKAELLAKWQEQQDAAGNKVESPLDQPTATDRQNAMVREREAAGADRSATRQMKAAN